LSIVYPNVANAPKCGACGCHRSLYQPPPSSSPSYLHQIIRNSIVYTTPSSQGDVMLIDDDDDDECLNELVTKMLRVNDGLSNVSGTPFPSIKVKLEFPIGDTNSEVTNMDVNEGLEVDVVGMPKKL